MPTKSRASQDRPELPAPQDQYNPLIARETRRIVQTFIDNIVPLTSGFIEGRYETLTVLPQDLILRGTSDPTFTALQGNTYTYNFADAVSNEVFFSVQLPHAWSGESPIYPHVRWSPSDTNTGTVRWELEYTIAKEGTAFPASTTITGETAGTGTADDHIKTNLNGTTGIDMTGDDISTVLVCRLIRNGGHANDTYTGTAALHSVGFVYLADSLGSEQAFIKRIMG